jgi:hypothetical protein
MVSIEQGGSFYSIHCTSFTKTNRRTYAAHTRFPYNQAKAKRSFMMTMNPEQKKNPERQGAGHAQYEADRRQPGTQNERQAYEAERAKSEAENHSAPKANANARQDKNPASGDAGASRDGDEVAEESYNYTDTQDRSDATASGVVPENEESVENEEEGEVKNINVHGAYGDPDEVDEIGGPPMENQDVEKAKK